jgi:N-methylhydantoinase B
LATAAAIDPVRVEILRHAFLSVADEMKIVLARTAHNPIIYDVLDFSCGVFDRDCRMIAQADGLPVFLGNLAAAVRAVVEDIGFDRFRPGDLYLINDPYVMGLHVNDVTTVEPVFHEGELVAFVSTRAHWLDIGGKDPGGSIDCTDIVQEGLWLRSVALYREGRLDQSVWRIIEYNVRYTKNMLGDLRAQVAASRTGQARFSEVVARHGWPAVETAIDELLRRGEQRARAAIAAMPDGVYEAEACLDDDCLGHGPLRVAARVTIARDELTVDLTGSSPQNVGPVNCGLPGALAACRIAFKAITSPDTLATEGDFAPLHLVVPEGSMFNARYPAPTFVWGPALILLTDVVVRALGQAVPERAVAAHYGSLCGFILFGADPRTGGLYIQQEPEVGGWGASPGADGESALIFVVDGDTRNLPAEVLESRFPLRLERYELRRDSGGAGRRRGGLGIVRDYRVLGHEAFMTCVMDRSACPPWGLDGGRDGAHDLVVVERPGGDRSEHLKGRRVAVPAGGTISVRTGGGGGYGDPFDRPLEAVRQDVLRGYVSLEAARDEYGVAFDPATRQVDQDVTDRLRAVGPARN